MKLCVNGEPLEIDELTTVRDLIEHLGLGRGPVAVERNGELVPRVDHRVTVLVDGDAIEVIGLSGGG